MSDKATPSLRAREIADLWIDATSGYPHPDEHHRRSLAIQFDAFAEAVVNERDALREALSVAREALAKIDGGNVGEDGFRTTAEKARARIRALLEQKNAG